MRTAILLVGCLLFGLIPAWARAGLEVTIDFDDRPGMTFVSGNPVPGYAVLTDQYAGHGVIFDRTAVVDLGAGHAVTGTNGIGGISPSGTLTYSSHYPQIEFSFWAGGTAGVTDFVSIRGDLIGNSGQSQTLSAFDLAGNLVGSSTVYDSGGQTYSITAPGIHLVKWSGVDINDDQGGGVALDHLVFEQPRAVPEPSSLLLALIGVGLGVPLVRRRRRSTPHLWQTPEPLGDGDNP